MGSNRATAAIFVGLVGVAVAALPAVAAAARVAIVKSSSLAPFESALATLTESLRAQPNQPEILTFDLGGDGANAPTIFRDVEAAQAQAVVTIGTLATEMALQQTSTLPLIFSMVLYPEQSGFLRGHARSVTGVSLDIPFDVQFRFLRDLLPSAQRLGVLYHPSETGSIVDAGKAAAAKHGFDLRVRAVDKPADAVEALAGLLPEIDALWSVADSHVFTPQTTPTLILNALRRRVPLFGISKSQARSGAVMALYVDYGDIGRQTAELVVRVLEGERGEALPVASPRTVLLALNERTAEHLGLTLAPQLRAAATEVLQ